MIGLQIKPVRESMIESLQLWKKIAGNVGDGSPHGGKHSRGMHGSNFFVLRKDL